jgi:hypothetical protein
MKFTISAINQAGIENAGLIKKTDVIDWCLLDYVYDWQQNPKATYLEGRVWLSFKHLIKEMPLLGLNTKSAVSNRIKKLRILELLDVYQSTDDFRLYVRTTILYYDITGFKVLPVHKKEQPFTEMNTRSREETQPFTEMNTRSREETQPFTEMNAPVHENEHSTVLPINSNTNEQLKESARKNPKNLGGGNGNEKAESRTVFKKPTAEEVELFRLSNNLRLDAGKFIDHYEANGWMVGSHKMKDWKATARNWHRRDLEKGGSNATRQQHNKPAKLSGAERVEKAIAEKFGTAGMGIIEGECRRTA